MGTLEPIEGSLSSWVGGQVLFWWWGVVRVREKGGRRGEDVKIRQMTGQMAGRSGGGGRWGAGLQCLSSPPLLHDREGGRSAKPERAP